jgi:hypothetical protein
MGLCSVKAFNRPLNRLDCSMLQAFVHQESANRFMASGRPSGRHTQYRAASRPP